MFSSTMGHLRPAFPPIWVPKYDIFPSLQVKLVLVAFLCRHVINKNHFVGHNINRWLRSVRPRKNPMC